MNTSARHILIALSVAAAWTALSGILAVDGLGVLSIDPLLARPAAAQAPWSEGFEGPRTTWRDTGGDAQYRVLSHQRVGDIVREGQSAEHVRIEGSHGTHVYFAHPVGRPPIIAELRPSVWVKSDRPGIQLLLRVSLPRTLDPRTDRPVETLIAGPSYTDVGRWQQLSADKLPERLARQVRALRAELGSSVDGREARVEAVVLNVYGGPGVTNVWIDQLEVAGHVDIGFRAASADPPVSSSRGTLPPIADASSSDPLGRNDGSKRGASGPSRDPVSPSRTNPASTPSPWARNADSSAGPVLGAADGGTAEPKSIALDNGVLNIDRRPTFPRLIQYRGEPLALLAHLGFNGIWLDEPADSDLLAEARRLGLWIVCKPPPSLVGTPNDSAVAARFEIGPEHDGVLAWNLGRGVDREQLDHLGAVADRLRAADSRHRRPVVASPVAGMRGYSRHADLLLLDRRPLGTSLELRDYVRWVRTQPRLARPGTPVWTTVQTQPAPSIYHQLAALRTGRRPPTSFSPAQLRLLAFSAVAAGSRGLLFVTESPLDTDDPATRERAMALELLNLELKLIEPWAAAGTFLAEVDSSHEEVAGSVLRTHRARLALPLWLAPGGQFVPGQSAAHAVSLTVPGAPESAVAYQLGPGELKPLKHRRVAGGMQVTLDEFGVDAMVVMAQDPALIARLSKSASAVGQRAARLSRDLAARRLHVVRDVEDNLPADPKASVPSDQWLDQAARNIRWADALLEGRQHARAALHARRAQRVLRMLQRARWESMVGDLGSPVSSPALVLWESLPLHRALMGRVSGSRGEVGRLAGGDFEDLGRLVQGGWQHFEHPAPHVESAADLVVEASHGGRTGLRLTAHPDDPQSPPPVLETAPLWVNTPPIAVDAGELLAIRAWVNVPRPITGSVDGLMIFDSISGEALAERIGQTDGWQPVTLYRVAPRSGTMRVTIALTGLGEARIDQLSVQPLRYVGGREAARPNRRAAGFHVPRDGRPMR